MSEFQIGETVRTPRKTMPSSTGKIVVISECGRYVSVRKSYGSRCDWTEQWAVKDIEKCAQPKPEPGKGD